MTDDQIAKLRDATLQKLHVRVESGQLACGELIEVLDVLRREELEPPHGGTAAAGRRLRP